MSVAGVLGVPVARKIAIRTWTRCTKCPADIWCWMLLIVVEKMLEIEW
jgi:hypothetical protein